MVKISFKSENDKATLEQLAAQWLPTDLSMEESQAILAKLFKSSPRKPKVFPGDYFKRKRDRGFTHFPNSKTYLALLLKATLKEVCEKLTLPSNDLEVLQGPWESLLAQVKPDEKEEFQTLSKELLKHKNIFRSQAPVLKSQKKPRNSDSLKESFKKYKILSKVAQFSKNYPICLTDYLKTQQDPEKVKQASQILLKAFHQSPKITLWRDLHTLLEAHLLYLQESQKTFIKASCKTQQDPKKVEELFKKLPQIQMTQKDIGILIDWISSASVQKELVQKNVHSETFKKLVGEEQILGLQRLQNLFQKTERDECLGSTVIKAMSLKGEFNLEQRKEFIQERILKNSQILSSNPVMIKINSVFQLEQIQMFDEISKFFSTKPFFQDMTPKEEYEYLSKEEGVAAYKQYVAEIIAIIHKAIPNANAHTTSNFSLKSLPRAQRICLINSIRKHLKEQLLSPFYPESFDEYHKLGVYAQKHLYLSFKELKEYRSTQRWKIRKLRPRFDFQFTKGIPWASEIALEEDLQGFMKTIDMEVKLNNQETVESHKKRDLLTLFTLSIFKNKLVKKYKVENLYKEIADNPKQYNSFLNGVECCLDEKSQQKVFEFLEKETINQITPPNSISPKDIIQIALDKGLLVEKMEETKRNLSINPEHLLNNLNTALYSKHFFDRLRSLPSKTPATSFIQRKLSEEMRKLEMQVTSESEWAENFVESLKMISRLRTHFKKLYAEDKEKLASLNSLTQLKKEARTRLVSPQDTQRLHFEYFLKTASENVDSDLCFFEILIMSNQNIFGLVKNICAIEDKKERVSYILAFEKYIPGFTLSEVEKNFYSLLISAAKSSVEPDNSSPCNFDILKKAPTVTLALKAFKKPVVRKREIVRKDPLELEASLISQVRTEKVTPDFELVSTLQEETQERIMKSLLNLDSSIQDPRSKATIFLVASQMSRRVALSYQLTLGKSLSVRELRHIFGLPVPEFIKQFSVSHLVKSTVGETLLELSPQLVALLRELTTWKKYQSNSSDSFYQKSSLKESYLAFQPKGACEKLEKEFEEKCLDFESGLQNLLRALPQNSIWKSEKKQPQNEESSAVAPLTK